MPREREYDSDKVVERAMHTFWARSYQATSVRDLVEATGVNRASLYAEFTDKRGLFLECLRRYDERQRRGFLQQLAAEHAPREAILAAFDLAATTPKDVPPGCLLVNTALELSPHDRQIRDLVEAAFGGVESFFYDHIRAAQHQGTIRADLDARETAQALLGLFLGLRVLVRSGAAADAAPSAITSRAQMLLE